jgi:hypothetical protein
MQDPLDPETEIVAALRLTAAPPQAWIEAAALIPDTLGELEELEQVLDNPLFRERFAADPARALEQAGLPPTESVVAAVRDRLG